MKRKTQRASKAWIHDLNADIYCSATCAKSTNKCHFSVHAAERLLKKTDVPHICQFRNRHTVYSSEQTGRRNSPQGRSLSWHGVPFVPPYHTVMQNAANPTAPLSHRTRELVSLVLRGGLSLKGHLSALVKCQPVHQDHVLNVETVVTSFVHSKSITHLYRHDYLIQFSLQ